MASPRPLLTFDLDGVLCRPPFGLNPGGLRPHGRRAKHPRLPNPLWPFERWRYLGRRPMPGAVEGFAALSERYECMIVSARAETARGLTERWLRRYLGSVPRVHLRPSWRESSSAFKARLVPELAPLAHFEDDPNTALLLAESLPLVFLVDWPRNHGAAADGVHRVATIGDAAPLLADAAEAAPA